MGLDRNSVDGRDIAPKSVDTDEAEVGSGTVSTLGDLRFPNGLTIGAIDAGGYDFEALHVNSGANRLDIGGFANTSRVELGLFAAGGIRWIVNSDGELQALNGPNPITSVNYVGFSPQDVRNISSPAQGWTAYHDGSGTNTEGPAHYNGTDWISTVDGSTIS